MLITYLTYHLFIGRRSKGSTTSRISLRVLQAELQQRPLVRSRLNFIKAFELWHHSQQFPHPCFPVHPDAICAFLVHKTNSLNGSTKSLRKWFGYLRSYSLLHRLAWLDSADEQAVKDVIAY